MRLKFLWMSVFMLFSNNLFCVDFHDFDPYQSKLTYQAVDLKIKKYLEKDSSIQKYYQLTPESLRIGDLDQKKTDYILLFSSAHVNSEKSGLTPISFKGLKNVRIALDPGHFGGAFAELEQRFVALSADQSKTHQSIKICEGDLTYLTALKLKQLLENEGATVFITRSGIGKGALDEDFFEWLSKHPDLKKNGSSLSQIFRGYYNQEDLVARVAKINQFCPDIALIIHYNAHTIGEEEAKNSPILTQSNYNLTFLPGAFSTHELKEAKDRYEFLRLIVTDNIDRSLMLCEKIVAQFVKQLKVPLITTAEKTSYVDKFCLLQMPGIYCRNLALTRLIHSPVCYGESLVQNNEEEVYRLAEHDTFIEGIPCSKRLEEVAQAYFLGIQEYFQEQ